ncbi:MAG: hypothetical protein JSW09_11505 [Pseudomonadota bacterium]|nr:MAG: hypothetical protein JSW09_11505 [Pseudomonadota bacterium]
MLVPRTYRLRLIIYIALLLSFLVGVLVLSYRASSEIVLREADANLARLAQQLGGQIKIEASDLLERAKMVRDSTSFQEYLFIAISLDTETGALREQFSRQFGWMQIDRTIVLARNGRAIYGDQHRDLSALLIERGLHKASDERLLYIDRADAVEMVAIAPIYYRSQLPGAGGGHQSPGRGLDGAGARDHGWRPAAC